MNADWAVNYNLRLATIPETHFVGIRSGIENELLFINMILKLALALGERPSRVACHSRRVEAISTVRKLAATVCAYLWRRESVRFYSSKRFRH